MTSGERPPDLVAGRYRVGGTLGAGGMGEVYAAMDETLRRRVALKAVKPDRRLDPEAQARFLREARLLSQLDHPHICRVFDYVVADGRDWLVLELIDGETLHRAIRRGVAGPDRLRIAEQIAGVLVATHAAGIVHRDLKPGNVMITRAGDVKVLDFGLSAAAPPAAGAAADVPPDDPVPLDASEAHDVTVTRLPTPEERDAQRGSRLDVTGVHSTAGAVMGTLAYMSPEQARGEAATPASDVYSFGLLLQELYTGTSARGDSTDYADALAQAQRGDTRAPAGVRAEIRTLIARLTAPIPVQRPTAVDVFDRLRWIREAPKRRMRNAVAAAVALGLLAGATKYTLDLSRERTAAVQARDEAAQRRDQAEDLLAFMLGDLRSKLQQVGRLDLLENVGERAMAYFGAVPSHALSDDELFRRSQAIRQLGEIRQARADLPGALVLYREALQLAEQVAVRDPSRGDWQLGVATAHFYVGDVLRRQRELAGAMQEFAAYRDIARRLVDRDPQNEAWLLELSYAHGGVAAVQEAQGDLEGARRELTFALALKTQLSSRAPDDVERLQAVATGHNRLGVVVDRLGLSDEAYQHFAADLAIRQRLVARDPRNRAIKRSLTVAHSFLGRALEDRGDIERALAEYRAWIEVAVGQVAADPKNAEWQRDLARAETVLATALQFQGRHTDAEAGYRRALDVLRPLAAQAATDAARQRDLARAEIGLGHVRLTRGDPTSALQHADAADRVVAPLLYRGADLDAARLAAEARLLAGSALTVLGNTPAARQARERARHHVSADGQPPAEKQSLATYVRVLRALGRTDDAQPLVARLERLGYRHPSLVNVAARP